MAERRFWRDEDVDRMRAALEFYANPAHYKVEYGEPANKYPILQDSGSKALYALHPHGLPDPFKQGWYVVNWAVLSDSTKQAIEYGPDSYSGAEAYRTRQANRASLLTHWGNEL